MQLAFWAEIKQVAGHEKAVGYRPDMKYSGFDETGVWGLELIEKDGNRWRFDCPIKRSVNLVHRERLQPGVRFTIQEGSRVIGEGVILSVSEG